MATTPLSWEAPNPGPWQQDSAHNPVAQTRLLQEAYPDGFNRGFEEAFSTYGVLLDRLAMASINGFTYHQPQPFDLFRFGLARYLRVLFGRRCSRR